MRRPCSRVAGGLAALYYSFKANPLPAIARELRAQGVRAEITSDGELMAAKRAGFKDGIVFGGPANQAFDRHDARANGVTHFPASFTRCRGSQMAVKAGVEITVMLA